MLAYHDKPELKNSVLAEMAGHREADRLVKGRYWEEGKGCAVGCLIKSGDHIEYESRFGIPKELAQLEDQIFEGLTNGKSQEWPERFLGAINPGADLSKVWNNFAVWLLIDPEVGVIRYADERGRVAIKRVADLHKRASKGVKVRQSSWDAAGDAAWDAAGAAAGAAAGDAAWDAARAAAGAAAWDAARAAAGAAAWAAARAAAGAAAWAAAWDAAGAAAWAAAWDAAGDAAYERMAYKLIELLEDA